MCLTTLELQGSLAAFVLCFVEGDAQRMWNTRFDPALERLSPGKLAMEVSVEHALDTGSTVYDFMRGEERYKSSYANHRDVAQESTRPPAGAAPRSSMPCWRPGTGCGSGTPRGPEGSGGGRQQAPA